MPSIFHILVLFKKIIIPFWPLSKYLKSMKNHNKSDSTKGHPDFHIDNSPFTVLDQNCSLEIKIVLIASSKAAKEHACFFLHVLLP